MIEAGERARNGDITNKGTIIFELFLSLIVAIFLWYLTKPSIEISVVEDIAGKDSKYLHVKVSNKGRLLFINRETAARAFETMGVTKLAKKWDLNLVDLNSYDSVDLDVPDGLVLKTVRVGRAVTEVDFLINVPVLKTHRGTLLSNCVKNIGVGVACREEKKRLHRLGIDKGLLDVFSVVKPHFNVVDALVCIEGDGPNFPPGKPRTLGLVMAGEDGVAVDAVCARLIGLDPLEVKHLRLAHDRGIGIADLGQIEVVGERLEDVATVFERPSTFID